MPLAQKPAVGSPSRVAYASDSTIIGDVVLNPDGSLVGGGGGGGGNVTIVGTTATGNTTSTTTVVTDASASPITTGAISIEFILSSDFKGSINGASIDNTTTLVVGVYRLDAPPWKPLGSVAYTVTAGSAIKTVQT